jgi:hypothetical protein
VEGSLVAPGRVVLVDGDDLVLLEVGKHH